MKALRRIFAILMIFAVAIPLAAMRIESERLFAPEDTPSILVQPNYYYSGECEVRVYTVPDARKELTGQKDLTDVEVKPTRRGVNIFGMGNHLKERMLEQSLVLFRAYMHPTNTQIAVNKGVDREVTSRRRENLYENVFPLLKGYENVYRTNVNLDDHSYWDAARVPFPKLEKGVYLVEVVQRDEAAYCYLTVTSVASACFISKNAGFAYVTDRVSGKPVAKADVLILSKGKVLSEGVSDKNGLYRFTPPKEMDETFLITTKDDDVAVQSLHKSWGESEETAMKYYAYTDRPIYRPGHVVNFKGIIRVEGTRGLEIPKANTNYTLRIYDGEGGTVYESAYDLNTFGSFAGTITLKESAPLGAYRITVNDYEAGSFKVDKYRKPEVEVAVTPEAKHSITGKTITAKVSGKYFFGEPVKNAKVSVLVYRERFYRPWWMDEPYWWYYEGTADPGEGDGFTSYYSRRELVKEIEGRLAADGTFEAAFETPEKSDHDYKYVFRAVVTDPSGQVFEKSASTVVTRSLFYITLKTDKWVYGGKDDVKVIAKVRTFTGTPVKNKDIAFSVNTYTWWNDKEQEGETKTVTTDENGEVTFTVNVKSLAISGWYADIVIRANAEDDLGNAVTKKRYAYYYGSRGEGVAKAKSTSLSVTVDKAGYAPGETVRAVVTGGGNDGYALLVLNNTQIYKATVVRLTKGVGYAEFRLESAMAPNVWIDAGQIYDHEMITATKELIVVPKDKFLTLEITPDKETYLPGEEATFALKTLDYKGNPVSAEVSVGIVDAKIYALAADTTPDIGRFFYSLRSHLLWKGSSFYFSFNGKSKDASLAAFDALPKKRAFAADKEEVVIRKNFKDVALWSPTVVTKADGTATVTFTFPDNLTRWRTTARAITKDTLVGQAIVKTIVKKDIMVRLALPRFLREKDEIEVSATVNNYSKEKETLAFTFNTKGANMTTTPPASITLAPGNGTNVKVRILADRAGDATFTATVKGTKDSDGVERSIPVHPYGILAIDSVTLTAKDDRFSKTFTLDVPTNEKMYSTEFAVNLSSSYIASLQETIPQLIGEPYGCVEQTMSKFLPLLLVKDILDGAGIEDEQLQKLIAKYYDIGVKRLYMYQHNDGGWGWWTDDETHPYMTAYALGGLALARDLGMPVRQDVLAQGQRNLRTQVANKENIDRDTKVFMMRTLYTVGERRLKEFYTFYSNNIENASPYSLAMISEMLYYDEEKAKSEAVLVSLANAAKQDARSQGVYWDKGDTGGLIDVHYYNFEQEATAYALKAIATGNPEDELALPALRWLLASRTDGHWDGTRTTSVCVHSIYTYLKNTGDLVPKYSVGVELNKKTLTNVDYVKTPKASGAPISIVRRGADLKPGVNKIEVSKRGEGTALITFTHKYFVGEEAIPERGADVTVTRNYYTLETKKKGDALVYTKTPTYEDSLPLGKEVLVELLVTVPKNAEYVMVQDFFPAGCEVVKNDKNYVIEDDDYFTGRNRYRWGVAAREVHDERVGFAITKAYNEQYRFCYIVRAENRGRLNAMPAEVYYMYKPDVRGNSMNDVLTVQ